MRKRVGETARAASTIKSLNCERRADRIARRITVENGDIARPRLCGVSRAAGGCRPVRVAGGDMPCAAIAAYEKSVGRRRLP